MKRPVQPRARSNSSRRRAVEAAVRHAEKTVQSTGITEAIIYRPPAGAARLRHGSAPPPSGRPSSNPTMELAIRQALGLDPLETQKPAGSPGPSGPAKRTVKQLQRGRTRPAERSQDRIFASATKKADASAPPKRKKKKKNGACTQPIGSPKLKSRNRASAAAVIVRKPAAPAVDRRKGASGNAAARLAVNERIRKAALEAQPKQLCPFPELLRRWQLAFVYITRFEDSNPDAPDVIAAKERLVRIELEWERRQALAPDHPDYFPWPSTEASIGDGSVVTDDWQEIGMLAYLGYRVDRSSTLTAAQRTQLLGRIFTMMLPPLNSISYMQQWDSPRTAFRLRKIAESLAAFARNGKRRKNSALLEAIRKWEEDLAHLRRTYYVNCFDFPWPVS